MTCPNCDTSIAVPKLGELRQLPRAESAAEGAHSATSAADSRSSSGSPGATIAFVVFSAIAFASLLTAVYMGICWAVIDASDTTETYMEEMVQQYKAVDAAVLIREYEDMEKYSLDLIHPYKFHETVLEKRRWGWSTVAAGCLALVSGCGSLFVASRGRR